MSSNPTLDLVTWIFVIMMFCLIAKLIWKNRKLYYYSFKIPGPFPWPLIGNLLIFAGGVEVFYKTFIEMTMRNKPIYKLWLGSKLIIVNSVPEDIEIILSTYMEKSELYNLTKDYLGNGLVTAPVSVWREHRKMINPSFNTKILTSFLKTFSKHSKKLAENLKSFREEDDLIPELWNSTLSISCETLADVDSSQITGLDEYISGILRVEQLIVNRACNVLYTLSDSIWKYSNFHKELQVLCSQATDFVKKVIEIRKINKLKTADEIRDKLFLNHLLNLKDNLNSITDTELTEETHTLLVAASETSAITLAFALLVLSIHTDIQKRVYTELYSIFGDSERDATLEDVNKMDYLERVIKEVMRLFPPIPLIARRSDKEMKINSVVYPEGSSIAIPIAWLNRNPKLWREPLKFDPDRFLPERIEKQERCTFIPFSFGSRNCIGFKYGMLAIKVILSTILRHFELSSVKYKSIWDIQIYYFVVAKPKDGCHVVLTQRKNLGII